jgi:hypothetical protein
MLLLFVFVGCDGGKAPVSTDGNETKAPVGTDEIIETENPATDSGETDACRNSSI